MVKLYRNSPSHKSVIAAAFISVLAVVVIGCGGGGSGVSSTNSTASTASSATTATTGSLPPNVILFTENAANGFPNGYYKVNPDGSGKSQLTSYAGPIAYNPVVKGQMVFGWFEDGAVGLFSNTTFSLTGAKTISDVGYSNITSIQVSPDGQFVYFIASIAGGITDLYKVPIGGGPTTTLAFSVNSFDVRAAGDMAVISTPNAGPTNEKTQVSVISTSGNAPQKRVTTDENHNYDWPQWSKDGTKIVLVSDVDNALFDVYTTTPTIGAPLTRITNSLLVKESGVAFSADGNSVAFIGTGASGSATNGIYTAGPLSSGTPTSVQIVSDPLIGTGIKWTSSTGQSLIRKP